MNAGQLDRRIDIQRPSLSQSGSGATSASWSNVAERYAARYRPLKGDERNTAPQWQASQQVEFAVRWRADLANLNPKDRVIYPAIMPDQSPEDEITEDRVFDVMEVHEGDTRREWLFIRAARFADGGALP